MIRLNDILTQVKAYHPDPDLDVIKKAYVYSAKVHQGQLRHSGEPYLVHPLEVAGILADLKLDEASIVTGLLHDTIEDTLATPEELTELFGPEVTQLVDGVTKLSKFQASATLSHAPMIGCAINCPAANANPCPGGNFAMYVGWWMTWNVSKCFHRGWG